MIGGWVQMFCATWWFTLLAYLGLCITVLGAVGVGILLWSVVVESWRGKWL